MGSLARRWKSDPVRVAEAGPVCRDLSGDPAVSRMSNARRALSVGRLDAARDGAFAPVAHRLDESRLDYSAPLSNRGGRQ